jgi:branched-subunit amino acid transport protein
MISNNLLLVAIFAMSIAGALIKIIPLVFFKEPIKNRFVSSFLKYVPFAVMTSIVVPEVFKSTSAWQSAAAGFAVSVVLGLMNQSLLTISLVATAAVFVVEKVMGLF